MQKFVLGAAITAAAATMVCLFTSCVVSLPIPPAGPTIGAMGSVELSLLYKPKSLPIGAFLAAKPLAKVTTAK